MTFLDLGPIRAVIFDMDGLMFNTETIYDEVGRALLQKRGHSFTPALKRQIMGRQHLEALELMRQAHQLTEPVEVLSAEADHLYLGLLSDRIEMLPGLESLLLQLEQAGIPKAVATSSPRRLASVTLGHFHLEPRFEFVLTGDDVRAGKPAPEIYLRSAEHFGLAPESILALEDSLNGSLAAVAAGMPTIAIPSQEYLEGEFDHVNAVVEALDSPVIRQVLFSTGLSR